MRKARIGRLHDSNDSSSTIDTRTIRATIVNEMRDYFSGNNNMNHDNVIPNESQEEAGESKAGVSATQQIRKRRRTPQS